MSSLRRPFRSLRWLFSGAALFALFSGCAGSPGPGDDADGTGGSGPLCPAGWTECASGCADLNSDGAQCGVCGQACPTDQVCAAGVCSSTCQVGTIQCGQSCVELGSNADHCGGCDQACGEGQTCTSSVCMDLSASGGAASGGNSSVGGTTGGNSSGGNSTGGNSSGGSENGTGGTENGELPFLIGADITHTMEDEHWEATYTDDGVQKPLEVILKDHGFNAIRIDTFVDPMAPGGYAVGQPVAFRGLAQTITLAQRVKAQDMFFLLDLHMSDTWTNPGAQGTPSGFDDSSLSALEDDVYAYVFGAVTQLVNAGARPDMVQVGNEITNGIMWELGRIEDDDFSGLAALLDAGISAVRAVDPTILVMLHIEKCNNLATTRWWLDGVLGEGVEFDVLGQSCYAPAIIDGSQHHAGYQGSPSAWGPVFNTIADEYPELKFVIAEYSAEPRAANDVVFNIEDQRGLGTFNWDPTRFYDTHPNVPLFMPDSNWNDFVVVEDRMSVYDDMAADYAAAGR